MRFGESLNHFFFLHFEWIALTAGLIVMATLDPASDALSICPINRWGSLFCPGEGFGRSVALFFRGYLFESFQMHPAGIPGILIITHRIFSIFKRNFKLKNNQ